MFNSNVLSKTGMVISMTNILSITIGVILITLYYFQIPPALGSYGSLNLGFVRMRFSIFNNNLLKATGGITADVALWLDIILRYSKILSILFSILTVPVYNLESIVCAMVT